MFEMPEAWPTSSGDTTDVEAAEAGPFDRPSPAEAITRGATSTAYVQLAWRNDRTTRPSVAATNPMPMAALVPIFTAIGVINGVMAISAPAAGKVANPA